MEIPSCAHAYQRYSAEKEQVTTKKQIDRRLQRQSQQIAVVLLYDTPLPQDYGREHNVDVFKKSVLNHVQSPEFSDLMVYCIGPEIHV